MSHFRSLIKRYRRTLAPAFRSVYFPPAVIFTAILLATMLGWQSARATLNRDIDAAAASQINAAEQTLHEHMIAYEQILRSGAGLFQSSEEVTREEWRNFLEALGTDPGFVGVQDVGFVKVLDKRDLPETYRFMNRQGIAGFNVTPRQPPRERYAVIMYIYSTKGTASLPYGFDMYTDPPRRAAMLQARDSGRVTITRGVKLRPDAAAPRDGFLLFAPYYDRSLPTDTEADRRAALQGYVYASFQKNAFFNNVIGQLDKGQEGFAISASDNGLTRQLHRSQSYQVLTAQNRDNAHYAVRKINLYGQTWEMKYAADSSVLVSKEQANRPTVVLVFGVLSASLIAAIVLLLMRARARDLSTQKEQAVELAKDELLSLASHQLRTPATGVKQYVGMLLQGFAGKLTKDQKELLEKAYASNDRQLRIINEILHLAKIGSGRIVLAKQKTNLNNLVNDIVNEQTPDIKSSRHNLSLKLPKNAVTLNADPHILRMAIENLLSNAIKYTPDGGYIEVNLHTRGRQAYITVKDTGVGIKPEDLNKVFRQFSRLPNPMSQQVGGTGIGLYLAKHLVELHKGSIAVTSQPGAGSKFTIRLPIPPTN